MRTSTVLASRMINKLLVTSFVSDNTANIDVKMTVQARVMVLIVAAHVAPVVTVI